MPAQSLPPVSLATETAGIQEPVTCVQPSQPASEGALCLANASDWLAKPYLPQRAEGMQSVGLQPWQSQTDSARGDSSPPLCDGMGLGTQPQPTRQYWSQQSLMVSNFPLQLKI